MFSIDVSFTGGGNDPLGSQTLSVPCPRCGFHNEFFLKQAAERDTIICRGCKANVQLEDHLGEVRKIRRQFAGLLRGLGRAFGG